MRSFIWGVLNSIQDLMGLARKEILSQSLSRTVGAQNDSMLFTRFTSAFSLLRFLSKK